MGFSGGISFETQKFAVGQRIGLKPKDDTSGAVEEAIEALATVQGDLVSILNALFPQKESDQPFGYDASVKWLAGFEITYGVLTLAVLLVDGQFYGLLIKIEKKKKNGDGGGDQAADDGGNGNGNGEGDGDDPFGGLELEIIYRKISDHLGEFSADLTLPKQYREIKLEAGTLTLPSIGLAIWTNGDFKVSIGWPLGDRSFNIAFPPDPIPWAGGGGLYFARLRSEDDPGKLGTNFNPIIEFGIALRIGAATDGNVAILKYAASLYLFGSFQGFLAWDSDHSFSHGLDYYWFCATVGISGHLEGSVDFVIIKVTVSLDLVASLTMAIETGHQTYAIAEFTAEVTASIKIVFFTIHFSFSLDVHTDVSIGSGPVALVTGPTPPTPPQPPQLEAAA
jgi:hypothetical protein